MAKSNETLKKTSIDIKDLSEIFGKILQSLEIIKNELHEWRKETRGGF